MKTRISVFVCAAIALTLMVAGTLKAQTFGLAQDFQSYSAGDSLATIGWSASDIQAKIVDSSGNKVLQNTVHNYGAAPVLIFVLPSGKTLANYGSLTFKGYFAQGDVGYKGIVVQAHQTMPTGHAFQDTLGLWNRAQMGSTNWENITVNIPNSSALHDTIYVSIGINCAGTGDIGGTGVATVWYADDVQLVAAPVTLSTSQDFQSYSAGDSLPTVGWSASDIQAKIVDSSGNKVLQNTVHNYGAAPAVKFVLPTGKTLADYSSFTFKGYFAQGDVGYKGIVVQAHQTMPTGPAFQDTLGMWNRAQLGSTGWENITVNIPNSSALHDTIYVDFGINCAGTGNIGGTGVTTIWYADDAQLVAKVNNPPPPDTGNVVTNGGFEDSSPGIVATSDVKGWVIQVADTVNPKPVFQIVSDTVEQGSRALKVTVNGLGVNQWDIQIVADSLHITPGALYDYSVWAKSDVAGATVNFTTWSWAGGEYKALRPATLTTHWQIYTMQFTVTDTSSIIRAPIHFYGAPDVGNSIYIDNLRIAKHIEVIDSSLIWKGPALAAGAPKFLGSAGDAPATNFASYWTQLTPENAGKWSSVGTSTDSTQWNWGPLDNDYNYAKGHGLVFKDHNLIWGNQQPSWISGLDSAAQYKYIETWIRKVGNRYPGMDLIDVVNEPLYGHNPPDGENGHANYENALGGTGTTGWDWLIKAFELARQYIPQAKLLINDYGILASSTNTTTYAQIVNLLKDRGLIDGIGCQAHGLESTSAATVQSNLDILAATGLPIYISEFDLNIQNDNQQKTKLQELFPVMWRHPGVKGVTLWGYLQGHTWLTNTYLVNTNGTARPALLWLADYIKNNPLGVEKTVSGVPTRFQLEQNYPNPFNPSTTIRYSVAKTSRVTLKVFDLLGREVQTLVQAQQAPGVYNVSFSGQNLATGVYFYRLDAGSFSATKKFVLMK